MFYQNWLAMRNIADVTGGKPIAVLLQPISGVSAINPVVAFYDIQVKREVLFFYFVSGTTRDNWSNNCYIIFTPIKSRLFYYIHNFTN
jgi:hypothetical protein